MKLSKLDRMLWFPVRSIDVRRLQDETTVYTESFTGKKKKNSIK